jgi:hypothetical protein
MLSTAERVMLLRSADIFNSVAVEDLVPVAMTAAEVSFTVGESLLQVRRTWGVRLCRGRG